MASYIFKACPKLNKWSSRQCPFNCSAISSSLLWQRGSRNFANSPASRSPFTMARTRAIPVAPVRSATARCTRTFICSRLFCIRRTQSLAPPPDSLCLAPACAAYRSAPVAGRPPAAVRNCGAAASIGNPSDPSWAALALGLTPDCRPAALSVPLPPIPRRPQSSTPPCSPTPPTLPSALSATSPSSLTAPWSLRTLPPPFLPLLAPERRPNVACFPHPPPPPSGPAPLSLPLSSRFPLHCPRSSPLSRIGFEHDSPVGKNLRILA